MYDELIKQLRRCASYDPRFVIQDCEDAADAIEDLEKCLAIALLEYQRANNKLLMTEEYAKQKNRWIPVTERLPEIDMSYPHHEDYLVQYDSGNMDVASWSNVNRFWTDHVTEPHWNCVQFAEVIAWMPLPQPPKDGET